MEEWGIYLLGNLGILGLLSFPCPLGPLGLIGPFKTNWALILLGMV